MAPRPQLSMNLHRTYFVSILNIWHTFVQHENGENLSIEALDLLSFRDTRKLKFMCQMIEGEHMPELLYKLYIMTDSCDGCLFHTRLSNLYILYGVWYKCLVGTPHLLNC